MTNFTRSIADVKYDAFSRSDIEDFLNENLEARNYCFMSEDEERTDNFPQTSQEIDDFKKTMLIPNGKHKEDSLFYSTGYSVCYMGAKTIEKVQMKN